MSNTPADSELRKALIEKYMEVAEGFYFEGSYEEDERKEYAPKFADEVIQVFQDHYKPQPMDDAELESRIDEILGMFLLVLVEPMGFGSDTDMQTFVGNKERHDESWQTARESIKHLIKQNSQTSRLAEMDRLEPNSSLAIKGGAWQTPADRKKEIENE